MPKRVRKFICQWCGNEFRAKSSVGHAPQYCSDECRKNYRRAYNTAFQNKRRKSMTDEELEPNREISRKCFARRTWDNWSEEADKILILANSQKPREAITKYLCDNYRHRSKTQALDLSSLDVARLADKVIAESLGKE